MKNNTNIYETIVTRDGQLDRDYYDRLHDAEMAALEARMIGQEPSESRIRLAGRNLIEFVQEASQRAWRGLGNAAYDLAEKWEIEAYDKKHGTNFGEQLEQKRLKEQHDRFAQKIGLKE